MILGNLCRKLKETGNMRKLNFPEYEFHIGAKNGKYTIFDPVRKRHVVLTPEEWVRQHVIQFLIRDRNVPPSLIKSESGIRLHKTRKRFDVAVFDRNGNALLIVECKSPAVPLSEDVLDQAVRYNMTLQVKYLMITNGMQHLFFRIDDPGRGLEILDQLPDYKCIYQA